MTTAAERQSRRRTKLNQIAQNAGFESWTKYETETIKRGWLEMAPIENHKPGQKFYIPTTGQIVYLSNEMDLLDTGETDQTVDIKNIPTISEEDAWEYEENHGQHN